MFFFKKDNSSCTNLFSCYFQAYTASFFAIPAFRWFLLQRRNAEIEERNRARLGWVAALDGAGTELRQKVISQFWLVAFVCPCLYRVCTLIMA